MIPSVHLIPSSGTDTAQPPSRASGPARGEFASALDEAQRETQAIRFSGHAKQRLSDRNIQLTAADHARIARSTEAAAQKGSRETLLIMDRLVLVVGVPNRTVITVMEPSQAENTVFTNIDSVVVVAQNDA